MKSSVVKWILCGVLLHPLRVQAQSDPTPIPTSIPTSIPTPISTSQTAPPVVEPQPATLSIPQLTERLQKLEAELAQLRSEHTAKPAMNVQSVQSPQRPAEPFAWGDFGWINGGSRQTSRLLDSPYFTPQLDIDSNYTYSFNQPKDNTIVGSTATARHNELTLAFAGIGGDVHVGNVRGRIFTQFGTRSSAVPRNDLTVNRGQFDLQSVYKYLSEAYAGYHFDKLHGINLDVGLFFSYVGLFSYTQFENWGYQASFTSDNTPWFFNGARLQIFPTDRLKLELWLINGWQTYGKFNQLPGVGYQVHYAPREWIKLVCNGYVGTDTQGSEHRVRFHSDNSVLVRYLNRADARGVSRAALSFTFDLGFEEGDGVTAFRGVHDPGNCTKERPCEPSIWASKKGTESPHSEAFTIPATAPKSVRVNRTFCLRWRITTCGFGNTGSAGWLAVASFAIRVAIWCWFLLVSQRRRLIPAAEPSFLAGMSLPTSAFIPVSC
uniref:Outer membrane protein n=1 Tax=uncultured bacterium A1Q1_fos_2386 TaxID=1256568 RepID=L7VX76_9BACT|nr:outer membrane protein [uncultured bacterium A1Q1_fos_2386]